MCCKAVLERGDFHAVHVRTANFYFHIFQVILTVRPAQATINMVAL